MWLGVGDLNFSQELHSLNYKRQRCCLPPVYSDRINAEITACKHANQSLCLTTLKTHGTYA